MVPAVAQAAVGDPMPRGRRLRIRTGVRRRHVARAVTLERAFQSALGGGCHTAFAARTRRARYPFIFSMKTPACRACRSVRLSTPRRHSRAVLPNNSDSYQRSFLVVRPRIAGHPRREQSPELAAKLTALGAEVVELPLISITKEVSNDALADVFLEFGSYDWAVFTSANGVRYSWKNPAAFLTTFAPSASSASPVLATPQPKPSGRTI